MAALTVLGLVTSAAGFGWIALLGVFGWCMHQALAVDRAGSVPVKSGVHE